MEHSVDLFQKDTEPLNMIIYTILAEMPGVARGIKKKVLNLTYVTPGIPVGFLKKFQPIRSSRFPCNHIFLVITFTWLFKETKK